MHERMLSGNAANPFRGGVDSPQMLGQCPAKPVGLIDAAMSARNETFTLASLINELETKLFGLPPADPVCGANAGLVPVQPPLDTTVSLIRDAVEGANRRLGEILSRL